MYFFPQNTFIKEQKKAKHTVEIKMEKGSESKAFTIVTMGWS